MPGGSKPSTPVPVQSSGTKKASTAAMSAGSTKSKWPRYSKDVVMASVLSQMNSNAEQRREERENLMSSLTKETDPEEQFLLSFLPLIRSFSSRTNMEFRVKFTQL